MSKLILCKVLPMRYITLPPSDENKSSLVNSGDEFECEEKQAKHYEKDGLVEILSDREEEVAEEDEAVIESDVEDEVEQPSPIIRRRSKK